MLSNYFPLSAITVLSLTETVAALSKQEENWLIAGSILGGALILTGCGATLYYRCCKRPFQLSGESYNNSSETSPEPLIRLP